MMDIVNYIKEVFQFKEYENIIPSSDQIQISLTSDRWIIQIENYNSKIRRYESRIIIYEYENGVYPIEVHKFFINDIKKEDIDRELSKIPEFKQRLRDWKLNKILNVKL